MRESRKARNQTEYVETDEKIFASRFLIVNTTPIATVIAFGDGVDLQNGWLTCGMEEGTRSHRPFRQVNRVGQSVTKASVQRVELEEKEGLSTHYV